MPGCFLHSQHSLPRQICLCRLLASQSPRWIQKLFRLHRWVSFNGLNMKYFYETGIFVWSFHFCRYEKPVKGRKINWMKAGILEADKVLTVSPYYAKELVSGVEKGVELDNILRRTGITGIINGMDVQEWNPLTDKYISIKYDASTVWIIKKITPASITRTFRLCLLMVLKIWFY